MNDSYMRFLSTFESENTKKVAKSLQQIGDYDYSNFTLIDLQHLILNFKPNSPKSITTITYIISLYAKFIDNYSLYRMVRDIDRNTIWAIAKATAPKKFISNEMYETIYHEVGVHEEHNSFYQQTLFRCIYEGIYNDDMSVIKNLRASDIKENIVTLREDNGKEYFVKVSDKLAKDLVALGDIDTWERNNRFGVVKINTTGLHSDSCFKVEIRSNSSMYSYRYSYYRILRKIAKQYAEFNLLPLQIYASGIMHRIKIELKRNDIELSDAFEPNNKDKTVNKIISNELERCNCDMQVRNFREMVIGHLDKWE